MLWWTVTLIKVQFDNDNLSGMARLVTNVHIDMNAWRISFRGQQENVTEQKNDSAVPG